MSETRSLSALHVSSKDLKVLRSLLGLSAEKARVWVIDSEHEDGDAVLVDVDHPDGAALWPELNRSGRVVVALTRQRRFPCRHVLRKPIRSQPLMLLLDSLVEDVDQHDEGTSWPVLALGEDGFDLPLAEHLRRRNWDLPVLIGGEFQAELIIDPGAGVWYSSASDRELARLVRRSFGRDDARFLDSSELVNHTRGLEQHSLTNLKWRAGLALSSSALHPDLAGEVRFMLPQVPMQALSDTAYSRQARVLIRGPATAVELLEASHSERSDVAEFLNACHVCGFLLIDSGSGQTAHAV